MENDKIRYDIIFIWFGGAIFTIALIWGILALSSIYGVWSAKKSGEAQLMEAEQNRQIVIQEAHAKMEAAKLWADADVERAKGIAKANQIIGSSLDKNEAYLRWLWIDSLQKSKDQIIYVPTEGSLPILEAGRHIKTKVK